jgi:hypothetical protein
MELDSEPSDPSKVIDIRVLISNKKKFQEKINTYDFLSMKILKKDGYKNKYLDLQTLITDEFDFSSFYLDLFLINFFIAEQEKKHIGQRPSPSSSDISDEEFLTQKERVLHSLDEFIKNIATRFSTHMLVDANIFKQLARVIFGIEIESNFELNNLDSYVNFINRVKEEIKNLPDDEVTDEKIKKAFDFTFVDLGKKEIDDTIPTSLNRLSNNRFSILRNLPNQPRAIKTKGGGDCALHAILGTWHNVNQQIEYADIENARQKIQAALTNPHIEEPLKTWLKEGIRDWVISEQSLRSFPHSGTLRHNYHQFITKWDNLVPKYWKSFEQTLHQHIDVEKYILTHHTLNEDTSLKDKFNSVLGLGGEKENELYALIASVPVLQHSFTQYNHDVNSPYDWDNIPKEVKEEFAQFIGTPRSWLAPLELNIIAYLFDKTIHYYPAASAERMEFNHGKSQPIVIQFNGIDHFERLESTEQPQLLQQGEKRFCRNKS